MSGIKSDVWVRYSKEETVLATMSLGSVEYQDFEPTDSMSTISDCTVTTIQLIQGIGRSMILSSSLRLSLFR